MYTISEETRVILNLLNKFGALTKDQIKKIFEKTTFNPAPMIAYLCNSRMIQFLDDNYAVLQNRPTYTQETLYCIWVMLDKLKDANIFKSREIQTAYPCDDGEEICFINNKSQIEYLTFIDKSSISKVAYIQDTFYTKTGVKAGEEDKSQRLYTFVCKDEETMDVIAEMDLTIPFMVAYIEGELTEVPVIEYYELQE